MNKQKLPEGWKEIELGDSKYFIILSSGINQFEGEKKYLSTESVQGTKINKIECIITYQDRPSRANMQPILNSVWFAKMQSTLKVYSFDEVNKNEINEYILSTGFAGVKVNEKLVFPRYLRLLFISNEFNEIKDKLCTGSTQRGINNKFIKKIKIIVPPLQIQKKIVSILEEAQKAKEWRKEADGLTKDFLNSVFLEMFGDPANNSKNFDITKLKDTCNKITDGTHDTPERLNQGVLFITGKNIRPFNLDMGNVEYVSNADHKIIYERCNPEFEDILYTNIGANVGTATINPLKFEFSMKNVALLKPIKSKLNSYYLVHLLNYQNMKLKILDVNSVGGAQQFLSLKMIRNFEIPLPPISLQNKFASIVKEVEAIKEQQKHSKNKIDNLFNALMQKAFKGELINGS